MTSPGVGTLLLLIDRVCDIFSAIPSPCTSQYPGTHYHKPFKCLQRARSKMKKRISTRFELTINPKVCTTDRLNTRPINRRTDKPRDQPTDRPIPDRPTDQPKTGATYSRGDPYFHCQLLRHTDERLSVRKSTFDKTKRFGWQSVKKQSRMGVHTANILNTYTDCKGHNMANGLKAIRLP